MPVLFVMGLSTFLMFMASESHAVGMNEKPSFTKTNLAEKKHWESDFYFEKVVSAIPRPFVDLVLFKHHLKKVIQVVYERKPEAEIQAAVEKVIEPVFKKYTSVSQIQVEHRTYSLRELALVGFNIDSLSPPQKEVVTKIRMAMLEKTSKTATIKATTIQGVPSTSSVRSSLVSSRTPAVPSHPSSGSIQSLIKPNHKYYESEFFVDSVIDAIPKELSKFYDFEKRLKAVIEAVCERRSQEEKEIAIERLIQPLPSEILAFNYTDMAQKGFNFSKASELVKNVVSPIYLAMLSKQKSVPAQITSETSGTHSFTSHQKIRKDFKTLSVSDSKQSSECPDSITQARQLKGNARAFYSKIEKDCIYNIGTYHGQETNKLPRNTNTFSDYAVGGVAGISQFGGPLHSLGAVGIAYRHKMHAQRVVNSLEYFDSEDFPFICRSFSLELTSSFEPILEKLSSREVRNKLADKLETVGHGILKLEFQPLDLHLVAENFEISGIEKAENYGKTYAKEVLKKIRSRDADSGRFFMSTTFETDLGEKLILSELLDRADEAHQLKLLYSCNERGFK